MSEIESLIENRIFPDSEFAKCQILTCQNICNVTSNESYEQFWAQLACEFLYGTVHSRQLNDKTSFTSGLKMVLNASQNCLDRQRSGNGIMFGFREEKESRTCSATPFGKSLKLSNALIKKGYKREIEQHPTCQCQ